MAPVVFLLAAVLAAGVFAALARRRLTRLARRVLHRRNLTPAAPTRTAAQTRRRGVGRRGEARLTARLLAGALSARDYQDAMAELAADEAQRHPMVVPGDE